MEAIDFIFKGMQDFFAVINSYEFAGAKLGIILVSMVITSMIISVFWRGARG